MQTHLIVGGHGAQGMRVDEVFRGPLLGVLVVAGAGLRVKFGVGMAVILRGGRLGVLVDVRRRGKVCRHEFGTEV
jgi:hypothetical protein